MSPYIRKSHRDKQYLNLFIKIAIDLNLSIENPLKI